MNSFITLGPGFGWRSARAQVSVHLSIYHESSRLDLEILS